MHASAGRPTPLALLAVLLPLAAGCAELGAAPGGPERRVRGPLHARVQHPIALTALAMPPRRAATLPEGEAALALKTVYTSIYELDPSGERVAFDGELLRASARLRYGLGEDTDLEIEAAGLYTTSGFLDSFVLEFHDLLGFPDGGRELAENDRFRMEVAHSGRSAYELGEDELLLGDLPIYLTHRLRREDRHGPAVALRLGLELPTGSQDRGSGNGGLDAGVQVLLERSLGRWTLTGGVEWIHTARPDSFRAAGVDLRDFAGAHHGLEYRWSDRLSLLAQLTWTSPFFGGIDTEEIDSDVLDLGLGLAWDAGEETLLTLSFHEDLIAATGPDFSVLAMLSWGF